MNVATYTYNGQPGVFMLIKVFKRVFLHQYCKPILKTRAILIFLTMGRKSTIYFCLPSCIPSEPPEEILTFGYVAYVTEATVQ